LDYCSSIWRPHLQKAINLLKKVQKRETRIVEDFRVMDYLSRLKFMMLTMLETRRLRAYLVEVFKILKGFEGLRED